MGRLAAAPVQLPGERETHGAECFFPSFLPFPPRCLMEDGDSHTHLFSTPAFRVLHHGRDEGGKALEPPLRRSRSLLGSCQRGAERQRADACCHARNQDKRPGLSPWLTSAELQTALRYLTRAVGCSL